MPAPLERMGDYVRPAGLWTQHGGVHELKVWSLAQYYTLVPGATVMLAKGWPADTQGCKQ